MNKKELETQVNKLMQDMKDVLAIQGYVDSCFIFIDKNNKAEKLPAPFSDENQKNIIILLIKAKCERDQSKAAFFIAEAYMKKMKTKDENVWNEEFNKYGSVSKMPGNVECIIIDGVCDGAHHTMVQEFCKNDAGKVTFSKVQDPPSSSMKNRFFDGIFNPPPVEESEKTG